MPRGGVHPRFFLIIANAFRYCKSFFLQEFFFLQLPYAFIYARILIHRAFFDAGDVRTRMFSRFATSPLRHRLMQLIHPVAEAR